MQKEVAFRLIEINRQFYQTFGAAFSATRGRIQPGVRRVMGGLLAEARLLDLGCGNGEFARALAAAGFRGEYLGLDFSLPLLQAADSQPEGFRAAFRQADLTGGWNLSEGGWPLITCFATLHHIPGLELRLKMLNQARAALAPGGRLILSVWQFLHSERLKARILPWERVQLSAGQVDEGDYLLDWRSGGLGLRYAHHFSAAELNQMAAQTGFRVGAAFFSDGAEGNLGLYQIWETQ
ncbi:MAG: hypothetical protein OHK0031_09460 [Anaerolineales bacterium]